jgi:hypothetical protein
MPRKEKNKIIKNTYKEEHGYAKLLLEELRREDKLFTSRFNLFLIAESLLFLSYATFLNIEHINKKIIIFIMGFLAILITIVYSTILRRTYKRIGEIRDELKEENRYYNDFVEMRVCKGHVHLWLWRLTLLFLFAWIGLLIFSV